ncbi:hypothetical protein [Kribbella sp. NPDC051620]|uniref:hypothetical protein n=1 Tax=Kribbella sp. NPDC051620 TaxID=3364120 RepID=UPI0037B787CD
MLKILGGVCLTVTLGLAIVAAPRATAATQDDPRYVKVCSPITHKCTFWLKSELGKGAGKKTSPGKSTKVGKRVCQHNGGAQACTSDLGNWSNSEQCYLQRLTPQPPKSDPSWGGHTDGEVWACLREQGYSQGRHLVTKWVWLPGPPDTVVVDPLTLAYEAIAKMQLAKPQVRSAPGVGEIGLVNMPVWLWVDKSENTYGPITRFAEVPGLRVTATGVVKAVDWTMGDGNTVRCEGAGTPYSKAAGIADSPDCGHRYRKTSHEQPKCRYPVSATAHWSITWQSTLGDTGQIDMTQQASTQLRIGEAVPVLVDPNGDQPTAPAPNNC